MSSRWVQATGSGSATAVPDAARVRVAVVHRADDLAAAVAGVESARQAAVAAARQHVAESAVASDRLSVHPDHDQEGRPRGYRARHGLVVSCPGLQLAGDLVGALAEAVGERLEVDSVDLYVADATAAVDAAREAAFADARRRARALAELAGGRLGEVLLVEEGSPGRGVEPSSRSVTALAAVRVSFEPGETAVGLSLTVRFALD